MAGRLLTSGWCSSADFPTRSPFYGIGTQPWFVAELTPDLGSLLYSSFTPESNVGVDSQGNAILGGTIYVFSNMRT